MSFAECARRATAAHTRVSSEKRALGGRTSSMWVTAPSSGLPPESLDYPLAYRLVTHIRWAVSLLAETIAALPLRFYTVQRNGKRIEIERERGNPRNVVELFETANPEYSGYELKLQLMGSLFMAGTGYLRLEFLGGPIPRQLWTENPLDVDPRGGMPPTSFRIKRNPGFEDIRRVDMPVFRSWNPDWGFLGAPPLQTLQLPYESRRDMDRWLRTFFKHGGVVAGHYSTDAAIDDGDREALHDELRKRNQSPEKFVNAVILPRKLTYTKAGLDMTEMQLPEVNQLLLESACLVYKIPVMMAGVYKGSGLNSDVGNMVKLQMFEQAIEPACASVVGTINEKVLALGYWGARVECEFDFSKVDAYQMRRLKTAESYVTLTGAPIMSRGTAMDEIGVERPKEKDPSLDQLLVPINMTTDAGGIEESNPPAGAAGAPRSTASGLARARHESRTNRRDRQRVRASRMLQTHERRMKAGVLRLLRRQEARVIGRLGEQLRDIPRGTELPGSAALSRAIDVNDLLRDEEGDRNLLERLIRAIVEDAGDQAIADLSLEIAFDMQRREVREWIDAKATDSITNINETTRERLKASLDEGVANGEGLDDLTGRVRDVFGGRRGNAQTIARTETIGPYNFGQLSAWDQSGVVSEKEWLTAHDDHVRDSHVAVEAAGPVSIHADFQVGSSIMGFPGDPRGDVSENANCRCTLLPVLSASAVEGEESIPAAIRARMGGAVPPRRLPHAEAPETVAAAPHMNGHAKSLAEWFK